MGTDIHMWAEIRKSYAHLENEQTRKKYESEWMAIGRIFPYPWSNPGDIPTVAWYSGEDGSGYEYEHDAILTVHPYSDRNYSVFAMLAGVRNGSGFAGVDTGDGFIPVAAPRGLPYDMSSYVRHEAEGIEHTPSWITLDELNAYDWSRTTTHRGWVDPVQFEVFRKNGKPKEWSGGVSGGLVSHVSNSEMGQIADGVVGTLNRHVYTQVEWEETYAESAGKFFSETLPKLREIRAMDRVSDLRLVFWFDS